MLDLFLYTGVRDYIYARISFFTEKVLSQNLTLALTTVLGLLTLWVMVQGYLIATGRSQEGLKGFVYNLGKSYFIVAVALGVAAGSSFGVRVLTEDLTDGISQIMSGNSDLGSECLLDRSKAISGCKIDLNLKTTQTILSSLSAIDTAEDDYLEEKLGQAKLFAGIGTAGPAIVAGTMLIMFRIAMALFIGFAPIFILCLLFKKTAPLFQKWLYYGLATIFSGVMLGVMTEISMDLVGNLFGGTEAGGFIAKVIGGGSQAAIMDTVSQQLGLGLILSTLLITVPPMAGLWFNGVMGTFSAYAVMGVGGASRQEVPPHLDGGVNRRANYDAQNFSSNPAKSSDIPQNHIQHTTNRVNHNSVPTGPTDTTKTTGQSDMGAAVKNLPNTYYNLPVTEEDKNSDQKKEVR